LRGAYGISFGENYSCIAKLDQNGNPEVIQNFVDGTYTLASAVYFEEDSENILYGELAKEYLETSSERLIQFVKREIGKSNGKIYNIDGKEYTAIEITSFILKKLKLMAEEQGESVKEVIVTVPAYYGIDGRQAIKNATELAGMNVKNIIDEASAAIISYVYKNNNINTNQNVLVFDLGGSTLDLTLARVEYSLEKEMNIKKITIINTSGDDHLGGKDWDDILFNILLDRFCQEIGLDSCDLDLDTRQSIRCKTEKTKKHLSMTNWARVKIRSDVGPVSIVVTIDEFEKATRHLLDRAMNTLEIALQEGKNINIDRVLLVGGSTNMPMIKNALETRFPGIVEACDYDGAVAKGAALYAAYGSNGDEGNVIKISNLDTSR
jgi:molecular chaperone DnaK (HSP70)